MLAQEAPPTCTCPGHGEPHRREARHTFPDAESGEIPHGWSSPELLRKCKLGTKGPGCCRRSRRGRAQAGRVALLPDSCLWNASPVQPHLPGSRPAPTGTQRHPAAPSGTLHPAGAWRCSGRFSDDGPGKQEGGGEANCGRAGGVTSAPRFLPRKHLWRVSACDIVVDVRSRPGPPGVLRKSKFAGQCNPKEVSKVGSTISDSRSAGVRAAGENPRCPA